ncbi:hypothetical protein FG91_02351 [Sphingopyxis sp. LC81]|uniref:hypothetical protein n=1 Tax=Sphingopyxis sp. LC81 TaxID=1502850 RepID=UPI00050F6FF5|nr:hypothetical protein [Sphingopyxis sp. LC81]KGB54102.1 hypothetical protein FG91_02351 [Sphingopyxis sp. LC81]
MLLALLLASVVPAGTSFDCIPTAVRNGDNPTWCEDPHILRSGIAARELGGTCTPGHLCPAPAPSLAPRDHFASLLGKPGDANLIGVEGGETVQSFISSAGISTIYSSQFPTLADALATWAVRGGELIVDADYSIPSPVSGDAALNVQLFANKEYVLSSRTERKITYAGAPSRTLMQILGADNAPLAVSGITFDGDNKTNKPLFIDYTGVTGTRRADLSVSGKFVNAYGTTFGWGDIAALKIVGGFDAVHIHDFMVENVGRAAGTTTPGDNGSQGVQLFGSGASNYRSAVIERGRISNLTTLDGADTANYADLDGILAFQEIESGARAPVIRNVELLQVPGRGIKMHAPNPGSLAENVTVTRSMKGVGKGMAGGPGHSIDIDFQHGDGVIRNITITYSGDAHYTKTVPIQITQVNARAADNRLGPTIIDGVRIADTTNPSDGIKGALISVLDNTPAARETRSIRISNIYDEGKSETLIRTNKLGTNVRVDVELNQIECDVSVAATRTSDLTPYLFVKGRNIVNRNGTLRPVKVTIAGAISVLDWGDWEGDATIRGFARYTGGFRGMPAFTNGFRGAGGGVEAAPIYGKSEASGRVAPGLVSLINGATWTGPPVGQYDSTGGDYTFSIRLLGSRHHDYARWRTGPGGTTLVPFGAIVGATIVKTDIGADTADAGKVVVWKHGASQLQKVSNHTGSTIRFIPVFND